MCLVRACKSSDHLPGKCGGADLGRDVASAAHTCDGGWAHAARPLRSQRQSLHTIEALCENPDRDPPLKDLPLPFPNQSEPELFVSQSLLKIQRYRNDCV